MFRKLMVAVDFGEGRGEFLKCLAGLRDFGVTEAVVAFCVDIPDIPGVRTSLKDILGGELDALCEIVRKTGITAHSEILLGLPSTVLTDAAGPDPRVVGLCVQKHGDSGPPPCAFVQAVYIWRAGVSPVLLTAGHGSSPIRFSTGEPKRQG